MTIDPDPTPVGSNLINMQFPDWSLRGFFGYRDFPIRQCAPPKTLFGMLWSQSRNLDMPRFEPRDLPNRPVDWRFRTSGPSCENSARLCEKICAAALA